MSTELTDYKSLFDRLSEICTKNNLGWVIKQVNAEIAEGKLVYKVVKGLGKRGTIEDFSDKERLLLLVSAVQNVIDVAAMEQEVMNFFGSSANMPQDYSKLTELLTSLGSKLSE